MTTQSEMLLDSFEVWNAETLRLTAFHSPTVPINSAAWWNDVGGRPPDTSVSRLKDIIRQEEGTLENGKLVMQIQSGRVDWVYTVVDESDHPPEEIPTIGPFSKTMPIFSALMDKWHKLEALPSMHRLAFGAILLQPVNDLKTGYERLAKYLPAVQLDCEDSSDFMYQINRPRNSEIVSGPRINRLSKWSVSRLRLYNLQVTAAQPTPLPILERYACRLELDINTAPEFQDNLPKEKLSALLHEFIGFGKEIAQHGDIR